MIVARKVDNVERTAGAAQCQAAVVVGVGLLLMSAAAIFAATVQGSMIVAGDAAATAQNILANELQFRLAVLSFLVVVVLDVIVAWGLYVFFKPVNKDLSLLAAWFRLVYAAVFAVAIVELGNALSILLGAGAAAVLETEPLQAQALQALKAFSNGWDFGLAIFGLHIILVGWLALKASAMPRLLGVLVVICGLGYLFDSVSGLLFPGFGVTISQFTFVGELLLGLWLLVKGVSDKQWAKLALKSA